MDEKIYKHSFENAVSRGEMTAFYESAQRSTDCIAAIDAAIEAGRHDQYFYKLCDSLNAVARDFSLERIEWVVAGAISAHDYDGRYSQQSKTWARDVGVPKSVGRTFSFHTHATVLDGFTDAVQAARMHDLAQVMGAYEQCHHMADRNRLTFFKIDRGHFAPKPGDTQRELVTRCTEIIEKQSVLAQLRAERKAEKAVSAPEKTVEHGHSSKFAEQILDGMEDTQRRGLFSTDEKNLVCNYAFHTGDIDKTRQLAEELAAARFGMQYGGGVHPGIAARANTEIAAIDEQWARLDAASPIAAVEMSTEQNYNQIDGLRNNMAVPPADLTDGQTLEEIRALAPETIAREKPSVLGKIQEVREAVPHEQGERHTPTKSKEDLSR